MSRASDLRRLAVLAVVCGLLVSPSLLLLLITLGYVPAGALREGVDPTPTTTPTVTVEPTSTPIHTLTPAPLSTATVPHTAVRVTWYGEAFRGGPLYCGTDIYGRFDPDDPTTVAMGADGPPCGSRLQLCSEQACIVAVVKDKCGGCGVGHIDLSHAAWDALGQPSAVGMTVVPRS